MISLKKLIGSVVLILLFFQVKGQNEVNLLIGDPAPAIKYSKWLKGEPITSFKGNQLYILEFWATWCGPCKGAMPHLTKLQKEYEGKVSIIGVDVWEKIREGQPYESSLPMVEKFVQGNSANMCFSVIADNNEEHMGNKWLKAAELGSIPATFIIKDEKIIWVGRPTALDTLLPKIFDGSYDMAAFKASFDKRVKGVQESRAKEQAILKPAQDALAAKEYKKALQLIEKGDAEWPRARTTFNTMKCEALLKLSETDAINFASQWQSKIKRAADPIFKVISKEDKLSKSTYLWAAKLKEDYQSSNFKDPNSPVTFNELASVYAKGGDYQKAIDLQQKAIEWAKAALVKGELADLLTEDHVTQYEAALTGYKKAGKK